MKNILALAFLLLAACGAFGQGTMIKQSEFDTVFKNSFRWRSGQPFRETRTQESIFERLPPENDQNRLIPPLQKTLTKSVSEYLPGVGYRLIYEFNSASLNKKTETVRIGNKTYTRDGDDEWTESITKTAESNVGNTIRIRESVTVKTGIKKETEYRFLGNETYEGQNVKVYAKIENSKSFDPRINQESNYVTTTKHFYAEDGKLLKTESDMEIRGANIISRFVGKTIYEIDPTIKITAPR